MSEVSELKELVAPKIKRFPVSDGKAKKEVIVGGLSLQMMLDIEEEHGDFQTWANKATSEGAKLRDVCDMVWGLCVNKEDFGNQKKNMFILFPANPKWLMQIKEIMLDILNDSMDSEESVESSGEQAPETPQLGPA